MAQGKKKNTPKSKMLFAGDDEMTKDLTQYVTTRQAAEMLGTSDANIRHVLIEGRVRGKKFGHYWLVYVPSLQQYFDTKSPGGRPSSAAPTLQIEEKPNGQR